MRVSSALEGKEILDETKATQSRADHQMEGGAPKPTRAHDYQILSSAFGAAFAQYSKHAEDRTREIGSVEGDLNGTMIRSSGGEGRAAAKLKRPNQTEVGESNSRNIGPAGGGEVATSGTGLARDDATNVGSNPPVSKNSVEELVKLALQMPDAVASRGAMGRADLGGMAHGALMQGAGAVGAGVGRVGQAVGAGLDRNVATSRRGTTRWFAALRKTYSSTVPVARDQRGGA
jgi:hypothetical protein